MQRLSPAFPCICGSQDWSYDSNQVRWICNQCVRAGRPIPARPDYKPINFKDWYYSVQHNYDTIREVVEKLEEIQPDNPRDALIHSARLRKAQSEKTRAGEIADLATYMNCIREYNDSGEMYVRLPEYEIEMRFTW